jgi:hypothetical protein
MTSFSKLTAKDFAILQGLNCTKKAWRVLSNIRDSCGVKVLLVCHLAKYWEVDESAILERLKTRF